MDHKRTVLIVEDNELNREILSSILEDTYSVLTAENGAIGIDIVQKSEVDISAILLDIRMPVMNGYEFLEILAKDPVHSSIPVIVTTASDTQEEEIHCLEIGASDFVTKPYNADVVKRRVGSLIRLCETTALLNRVERDAVTGAYSREFFLNYVEKRLQADAEGKYDMVCLSVDSYRLLLDRYGARVINAVMRSFFRTLVQFQPEEAIAGRLAESQIALLVPHRDINDHRQTMSGMLANRRKAIPAIVIKCGVYQCVDRSLSVETMCSNAIIALDMIRDHYFSAISVYDDSIRARANKNQMILDIMGEALKERQFIVYYQPKYDPEAQKVCGCEALIRWIHPQMGFMSPDDFIPLFEHNGFIHEVDRYMVDAVCRDLSVWLKRGHKGVPVSINVSQADFDQPDLVETYESIVDAYSIPHELVHFEITESANASDAAKKLAAVQSFNAKGFKIELDDFGVGYSTLSSLGALPIHVMKLDKSLVRNMFEPKFNAILVGIIYTAASLGLEVVAEGVETQAEADALRDMAAGKLKLCVQGYYFSRALPRDDFEALLTRTNGKTEE